MSHKYFFPLKTRFFTYTHMYISRNAQGFCIGGRMLKQSSLFLFFKPIMDSEDEEET